jgi:hypothetical protein
MNEPVAGITASTKRSTSSGGRQIAPTTLLASVTLAFSPLPLTPEVGIQYKIESPRKGFETGVMGDVDIKEGDILTTGGIEYTVRAVGKYPPVVYMKLIIEQVIK